MILKQASANFFVFRIISVCEHITYISFSHGRISKVTEGYPPFCLPTIFSSRGSYFPTTSCLITISDACGCPGSPALHSAVNAGSRDAHLSSGDTRFSPAGSAMTARREFRRAPKASAQLCFTEHAEAAGFLRALVIFAFPFPPGKPQT